MKVTDRILFRKLLETDFKDLDKLFGSFSVYKKPFTVWQNYWQAQEQRDRLIQVIEVGNNIAGYGTLKFTSDYAEFRINKIPEINDVLIAPEYRNQGLGKRLITVLEELAKKSGHKAVGLAVGLYQDYGQAQRLYIQMGYIPNGKGITYKDQSVVPGEPYPVDDELLLWLTKSL